MANDTLMSGTRTMAVSQQSMEEGSGSIFPQTDEDEQSSMEVFVLIAFFVAFLSLTTYFYVRLMLDPNNFLTLPRTREEEEQDGEVKPERRRSMMVKIATRLEGFMKTITVDDVSSYTELQSHEDDSLEDDFDVTITISGGGGEDQERKREVDAHCSVCLEMYEPNDTIVWSPNPECPHAYHKECILEWLGRGKKHCPCCRHDFVEPSHQDQNALDSDVPVIPQETEELAQAVVGLRGEDVAIEGGAPREVDIHIQESNRMDVEDLECGDDGIVPGGRNAAVEIP